LETSDNTEDAEDEESDADEEEEPATEDEQPEAEDASEEATDDGDEEVVESFMEIVRQKDALEEEVLALKEKQTVSDAEVKGLKEELDKYKTGFMRVSELASKSNKLQKKVASLNEQLSAKDATIQDLQNKAKTKLNESVERSNQQLKELQERLITSQNEAEATEQALREQVEAERAQTRKVTTAAKAYKQKYVAVVEHYIASKATMLGVSTHDITSKLNEGYTLEDVDRVCEKLLDAGRPAFNLGMGAQRAPQVKLKESTTKKYYSGGYDIDDDLLELAGLK
jgi:chromosome segregation ATPase